MPQIAHDSAPLTPLLEDWRLRLTAWAQSGVLSRGAMEALRLPEEPEALRELVGRWGASNWRDLPPVEVLPASAMPTAAGAYALATGTIYLNQAWLEGASEDAALAVLTEELGHHLDGLLNSSDTPGDEGELFAAVLIGDSAIGEEHRQALSRENDAGRVWVEGQEMVVEQATVTSTTIPVKYPGCTTGEFRNPYAFAALKADGSVVTWGYSDGGGTGADSSSVAEQLSSGVTQVFSNQIAFAALKSNGSVVCWGNSDLESESRRLTEQLSKGVTNIFSTALGFAALKDDGSVVTWGSDSSRVSEQLRAGVINITSNYHSFAALKNDGSIATWGPYNNSGVVDISSGIKKVFSTKHAFAALKTDGSVVTWGIPSSGGDSRGVADLRSDVYNIFSTENTFVALKMDGSLVTWGGSIWDRIGGAPEKLSSKDVRVFSTIGAFAALEKDGSVITWGNGSVGGDSWWVANKLKSGVISIFANSFAFAALKSDGSVVTWGMDKNGGDSSAVAGRLNADVIDIVSNVQAFAALKSDGSVITWGDSDSGGNSSSVAEKLRSGVTKLFSNDYAFAALKQDGTVVTWGSSSHGGDSSAVASQLTDVVAFANPFTHDRLIVDAPPSITLAASPTSVKEDETSNLTFLFSRTGSASNALTVNYAIAGSATRGSDYTGLPIHGSIQSITFPAGALTASITLIPIPDCEIETDETITLTLAQGNGYNISTTGTITGTIVNDDSLVESAGNTQLIRRGDGSGHVQAGISTPIEITSPWGAPIGSDSSTWQILAADTIAGVNQILWRNNSGNFLHTWTLDANWRWTSSFGMIAPSSPAGWDLETVFQVDANGDNLLGNPFDTIETKGNSILLRHANGQAFAQVGNAAPMAINSPWGAPVGSPSTPWQIIAIDTIGGVNQLLWRNNSGNFLHTWDLDRSWNWTASNGTFDPNATAGWSLEASFQIDANGDGIIGSPHSTIEAQGNTSLLRHADGRAFAQVGNTAPIAISSPWNNPVGSLNSTWQIIAAETIAGVNQVLLRNNSDKFLHTWTLNSNWNWTSSGGTFALDDTSGWTLESSFQVDANNDGIIGSPFSSIEARGTTTLLRRGSDDQAFVQVGTSPRRIQVKTPWGAPVGTNSSTWQILAADTIAGVNQLLLRNNTGNFLHTWTLDSNWNWTASNGTISPTSPQGLALLNQFGLG